ncbi:hypothetical protein [Brucella anthropi]|uniref:hypothetical protein n=1 Tax=Brucella anthropi TaxID=529 RepID=UPI00236300A1|nr:hypothetical protein [Brucella anthropi]
MHMPNWRKLASFMPLFRLVAKGQHCSKTIETAVRLTALVIETLQNPQNLQQNTRQCKTLPGG